MTAPAPAALPVALGPDVETRMSPASVHLRRSVGALLLLIMSGCSAATAPVWPAMLSVVLTDQGLAAATPVGDAPQIVSARVTISRVYLQGEHGRQLLLDREETVDLLALDAHAATLVERTTIPAGRYGGMHLVVSGAYLEVIEDDGSTRFYSSSPSYSGLPEGSTVAGQLLLPVDGTALQVQVPNGLHLDRGDHALHVRFDVRESFAAQAGLSGRWVMTPSITARTVR